MPDAQQDESPGSSIWLYNGRGKDAPIKVQTDDYPDLNDDSLLWADVDFGHVDDLRGLWRHLGIAEHIDALAEPSDRFEFVQRDGGFQLTVPAVRNEPRFEQFSLACLVGNNWVVTLHDAKLDLIDEFNKPFHGDTQIGELDGPVFVSMLLDWQLAGFFRAIEDVQDEVDRLDEDLLGLPPDERGLLKRLQSLRRRVRELRRALSPQREALALLSHPEGELLTDSRAVDDYQRLAGQLERALEAVDTAREMIVGSFDIFMTRTAQATNEIMKRLTIVSVLLLPGAVIAGIMGMNFKVGLFDVTWMFWVTLGLMALLAAGTLVVAKRKKWI